MTNVNNGWKELSLNLTIYEHTKIKGVISNSLLENRQDEESNKAIYLIQFIKIEFFMLYENAPRVYTSFI